MQPFDLIKDQDLARIRVVMTDIDDTLTRDGRLPAKSLECIEQLSEAGLLVIPVTGRPAGWCDLIARMWDVAAVVGENGALYFSYDRPNRKMRTWYQKDAGTRRNDRMALDALASRILKEVPGTDFASDQAYRISDVAIDFNEDVAPLPMSEVNRIKDIFESGGATAKISSIHVNAWFGNFNKLSCAGRCLSDLFGIDLETEADSILFVGDSPNDEPMFSYFNYSVGVANVREFELANPPKWITSGKSADGFAELTSRLLAVHRNPQKLRN